MLRVLILFLISSCAIEAADRPNIVFFLVDDMGWKDTSVNFGEEITRLNRQYHTPNMERLAEESVLFTNAYATAICSPTRISLMTGQNAARHKVTCWTLRKNRGPDGPRWGLQPPAWPVNGLQPPGANIERSVEAKTLPIHLRELGYRTIHAGKAHFGSRGTPGADPTKLGFDVNIAGSYMGGPGSYHGDKNFSAKWRGGGGIWDVPGLEKYHGQEINLTEAITREVMGEVRRSVNEKKPFYLYLSHYAVHAPWEPDRRFIDGLREAGLGNHQAVYASMLRSMDKSLGDVMDLLEELGIAENTVILFMSDNGSPKQNPRNLPLRGHKISAYEGGARVPMMLRLPGMKDSSRSDRPVIIEDVFPTILQLAGAPKIPENDGVSFSDPADPGEPGRALFWHYPNTYDQPPFSSVRVGDLKLIHWHRNGKMELFDLAKDIGEANNLAAKRPADVKRLASILGRHLRESEALMPLVKATGKPVPWPDQVDFAGR